MKTVIIKNYIQGLASFLDEKDIKWESVGVNEVTKIYFETNEQLFRLGFEFGRFFNSVE